jgi:hypothetical protein
VSDCKRTTLDLTLEMHPLMEIFLILELIWVESDTNKMYKKLNDRRSQPKLYVVFELENLLERFKKGNKRRINVRLYQHSYNKITSLKVRHV